MVVNLGLNYYYMLVYVTNCQLLPVRASAQGVEGLLRLSRSLPRACMCARGRVIGLSVRIFFCLFVCLLACLLACLFVCSWHKSNEFEQKRKGHDLYLQRVDQKWKYLTFYVPHVGEQPLKSSEKLCF